MSFLVWPRLATEWRKDMRADETVIEYLNKALRSELTAINQY